MQDGPIFLQIEERQHFPSGAEVLLNWDTIKQLGISIGKNLSLSFGLRRASVKVGTHAASKSIILIHRSLAEHLLIPTNMNIQIRYISETNEIQLGPVLGILISRSNFTLSEFVESYGSFCKELFEAAQKNEAFCYVTNLDSIMLEERKVRGWILQGGSWIETTLPLPNVFYNRLGSRMKEKSGATHNLLQNVKTAGISIFNEQFLDKWDVYQHLSLTPIHQYLPLTNKYSTLKKLLIMMSAHPVLYLKPVHGSEGRGIIRLHRCPQNEYTIDQITLNGTERHFFNKISEMLKYVSTKLKKKSYLIQQGIDFVDWEGTTVDFRALLQKNSFGNWKVVSLIARLGNPHTFVSNLAQGGKLESAVKLIQQLQTHYHNIPSTKDIKAAALEIATTLDSQLEGNYGEFGIDLGIDRFGRIWLIEVNSKPSKRNDAVLETVKGPRPSVLHLYEYVSYLSGFTKPIK